MNQEVYGRLLQSASTAENLRMREIMLGVTEAGNNRRTSGPPQRLLEAAKALRRKGSLTASDLGYMLKMTQPNAAALLSRLEKLGIATSELNDDPRVRIFRFVES